MSFSESQHPVRPGALDFRKRPRWRRIKWLILGGVGLLAGLGVTAWLAFQHIPSWYRPTRIPKGSEQERILVNETINHQDRFSEALYSTSKPFEFSLTLAQINRGLAVREGIWPETRDWLPASVSDPFVVLENGVIRLAATYRSGSLATIVSARLEVDGRRDGIWIKLKSIELGSLPLPLTTVRDVLHRLDSTVWPPAQAGKYLRVGEPMPPLTDMLQENGMRLPNAWIWWSKPRRSFWAYALEVRPDAIVAHVEALSP